MKTMLLRYVRLLEYLSHYLFLEFPRGLDFSIRAKKRGITLEGNHGYALTSKKALKNILSKIPYRKLSFLDIGSGKGGVICYAYELGCERSEGIEYEEFLHKIAQKNIKILEYNEHVKSTKIDARDFERYAEFDIYFMFNPFDPDIYSEVVNSIFKQNKAILHLDREKYLICYGDANLDAVNKTKYFELLTEQKCPYRGNLYRIYKSKFISTNDSIV